MILKWFVSIWVTPNRCLCLIDSNTASFWGWNWLLGYECQWYEDQMKNPFLRLMISGADRQKTFIKTIAIVVFHGACIGDAIFGYMPASEIKKCYIDFFTNVIIGNKNFIWTNPLQMLMFSVEFLCVLISISFMLFLWLIFLISYMLILVFIVTRIYFYSNWMPLMLKHLCII